MNGKREDEKKNKIERDNENPNISSLIIIIVVTQMKKGNKEMNWKNVFVCYNR